MSPGGRSFFGAAPCHPGSLRGEREETAVCICRRGAANYTVGIKIPYLA